jgi:hypothetical protein
MADCNTEGAKKVVEIGQHLMKPDDWAIIDEAMRVLTRGT